VRFSDVQTTDYFYTPVQYLACHGAISGYGDGTFRPYNNTTRGQLAKIIVGAEGWPVETTDGPHFGDVPASNPFYPFVETAYNRGVISGYGDGTFRPYANVTRGQLTKITVVAAGWVLHTTGGPHFSDVPSSQPFYSFIETAYRHGVISGYSDGTFRPYNNATRAQTVKIVTLAFGTPIYTPPAPTFRDVPATNPFYGYIETAAHAGIIGGYSDGTFRPYADVTRGQLSKIVVLGAAWTQINPASATFTDVTRGSTFYTVIETAVCHGAVGGYSDGTFRPYNNATRAQISKIVYLAVTGLQSCR